ncbi:thioredoxin-1 [[Candida] jaroonii]|uniref:Thioredoxin-1 n=1 Tax=[Candida] jaroonii TaxID=467808 RepID=A0ACA9Y6R5_9ASCO|nr:thioredoxin-1 [[Candida] jaroonii]
MFKINPRSINFARSFSQSLRLRQVQEIESVDQYRKLIANEGLTFIDFYATWCGPCKAIEPIINKLSEKVPEISFARVDVDQQTEIAKINGISAMPTLILYKDGGPLDGVIGADIKKIMEKLSLHSGKEVKL